MSSLAMSVRPSTVGTTLERGYTISTWLILFKFGLNIDIGLCMSERGLVSKFKL